MRVNPRGKFAGSDILFYYLFQRNGNKNGSYLINAFNEVSDSVRVSNLNSIKESVLSALRWSDDKFWNNQMQHHLYQMSLASYDTTLLNKTNNPNNAKIINYLLFLEKEGSKSKDTLTQALTGHLDSIVKRSIMTKAPELIKKDLISYVEGVCMSQVKKSMKESVYFTGEAHHSSYNSSPGAAKFSLYPDGTASLNLTIFFNGEAMYKHLNGKVVKTSNGLYQFVSRESAFSFRYDVDQCGKKTLELAGLAQNSTIKALFTIK